MKTKRLGSQGPEISVVGFGAWEIGGMWGTNPEVDDMIAAIHAGIGAGMNWVDTAEVYGSGYSEEIVGRAIAGRDEVFVFTKVAPQPTGTGFRPEQVREAAEKSIKRLGREVIDLYQLHWPDSNVAVEDTWGAMADLSADGLVRYIGVSNFDVKLIERCEAIRHVDSLQPHFSMIFREPEKELLPHCDEHGIGVISYGPLGFGLLTGAVTMDTTFEDTDWRSGKIPNGPSPSRMFGPEGRARNLEKVERLRPIAARLGISLAELALAWNVHQRGVTGAIAGSRQANHTIENARAGDLMLSKADLDEIEKALS